MCVKRIEPSITEVSRSRRAIIIIIIIFIYCFNYILLLLLLLLLLDAEAWAGYHDNNAPDRPSAKVAPVGRQLATMAFKIKTITITKKNRHGGLVAKASAS